VKTSPTGKSRATETPVPIQPSAPPRRLFTGSGWSGQGRLWRWRVLTLPKAARMRPALTRRSWGSEVKVMKPSSTSTPSSPNERKKSARA
jgi:hypothetical protein